MTVGWQLPTYTVNETLGQVSVCAALSGLISRNVVVSMSTSLTGTAQGMVAGGIAFPLSEKL